MVGALDIVEREHPQWRFWSVVDCQYSAKVTKVVLNILLPVGYINMDPSHQGCLYLGPSP